MKKIIAFASLALLFSGAVSAQKATSGAITVEGQLSLWGPTQVVAPIIRGRYFITDDLAARLQLGFYSNNNTSNFTENPDGTGGTGSRERSNSMFDIRLGIEKHLSGTDKLSPYLGAEFMFGSGSASETWTNSNNGTSYTLNDRGSIDGAWSGGFLTYAPGTTIGFNVLVGADYYLVEKLYIGGEFGYGFMSNSGPDVTTELSVGGVTGKTVAPGGSSSGLGMYNTAGLRIGLKF